MKKFNIRPAFQYRFWDQLKSIGIFFGIMVLIISAFAIGFVRTSVTSGIVSSVTFSSYGIVACIMVFVSGIVTAREDLRLCIQHGVGRRTAFVAGLISALSACFILAVAGELLLYAAQALTAGYENLHISDLYHILYADRQLQRLSFGQHLESAFFNLSIMLSANMAGMFISLVFFRLNKVWTVIIAVGAPIFLFVGLPILINFAGPVTALSRPIASFANWVLSFPWAGIFFFVLVAAVTALLSWLVVRRAPINDAKL